MSNTVKTHDSCKYIETYFDTKDIIMISSIDLPSTGNRKGSKLIGESLQMDELADEESFEIKENIDVQDIDEENDNANFEDLEGNDEIDLSRCFEKSVIIHRDENGFGLRVKGQAPVIIEHVHENGAAWRAGVRNLDQLIKVNGFSVTNMNHKDVVLLFKSCTRFVALTLVSNCSMVRDNDDNIEQHRSLNTKLFTYSDNSCVVRPIKLNLIESSPNSSICSHLSDLVNDENRSTYTQNSSPTLQNKLMIKKHSLSTGGNCSAHSCSVLQLPNGVSDNSSVVSISGTSISSDRDLVKIDIQSPATALRRESVSYHSSYLNQKSALNRDKPTSTIIYEGVARHSTDKLICINCRVTIEQRNSEGLHDYTCQQCRLHFNKSKTQTNHPCQRVYGSLRDSRQEASGEKHMLHSSINSDAPETQHSKALYYKLNQSASTNSLPYELDRKVGSDIKPRPLNKRLEVIREFIDTEKTHTDRLRCLDELFYRPLKSGGYITPEQLRQVFSCHRTLYRIHRQIYRILLSANYSLYVEPMIGSALLEIFEGDLKRRLERAACSFCAAQSTNSELLNKLTRRDTKVGEFLAHVTSQMVGRLGIKDLLASCFQRLTKYPLLLECLLKATPQPILLEDSSLVEHDGEKGDEQGEESNELRNSRRMLAISLAEEREFIERALLQSRQILVRVNDAIKVSISHNKLKEIWKRTDKYPGVPLIDITKQQVIHEGSLTLRLSKRSFDVYVLLLTDYIIILTREGQDKYRLKFFTPEGKSNLTPNVFSPVFIIDEHLTTRDAATDENGFYLLCKKKDDSRIYEFASRSPAERLKWRDKIQWTIERQANRGDRRLSCESTMTKSSSEISAKLDTDDPISIYDNKDLPLSATQSDQNADRSAMNGDSSDEKSSANTNAPTKIEGTISYVEDDGIVMPSKMASSQAQVDHAIQVNIFDALKNPVISN